MNKYSAEMYTEILEYYGKCENLIMHQNELRPQKNPKLPKPQQRIGMISGTTQTI